MNGSAFSVQRKKNRKNGKGLHHREKRDIITKLFYI